MPDMLFIGEGEGFLPRNYGAGPIEHLTELTVTQKFPAKLGLSPEQWYEFWKLGDANLDGHIDQHDLDFITQYLGSWHPAADINEDNIVDNLDLQAAAEHYGMDIWSHYGVTSPQHDLLMSLMIVGGGLAIFGVIAWAEKKRS